MTNTLPMSFSKTHQTRLIMPSETNHHKSIFGGQVLWYIDEIAALAAMKHSKGEVVTASIDSVDFISSAYAGDVLELESIVTSTGRTSMEVYVRVICRDLKSGAERLTTESFVTLVAIDENGKPRPVVGVHPETETEKRLFETASFRREYRKKKREMTF
ncbi:MAG: acyl-CoA thioesterase [Lysinibacillus sp.]